jgi:hypothetical protein
MRQAWRQRLLEAAGDGRIVPAGFGQEALQHAGRSAFDRFGEVLGIPPLGGLDEEALQVVPAALAPLLAAESRGECGMKLTKGFLNACELLQIHGIAPGAPSAPKSYLIRLTRRCKIRRPLLFQGRLSDLMAALGGFRTLDAGALLALSSHGSPSASPGAGQVSAKRAPAAP